MNKIISGNNQACFLLLFTACLVSRPQSAPQPPRTPPRIEVSRISRLQWGSAKKDAILDAILLSFRMEMYNIIINHKEQMARNPLPKAWKEDLPKKKPHKKAIGTKAHQKGIKKLLINARISITVNSMIQFFSTMQYGVLSSRSPIECSRNNSVNCPLSQYGKKLS
jgi:hypothetical protein